MNTKKQFADYLTAANYIKSQLNSIPETAVIIGSAMIGFTQKLKIKCVIKYKDIPFFPITTVSYQKGELIYGELNGHNLLVMNGRFHYYEGYEMWQTVFPIFVFKLLGIKRLIITNAAGGIDESYRIGDLVVITDHIKLTADSPLRGENIPEFGERFFDMQNIYNKHLTKLAFEKGAEFGIPVKQGVYAFMGGPQYETPAEIKMLKMFGATLVGMSTVPETIAAAHCNIPVLAISCVCNMAAGMTGAEITGKDVESAGNSVSIKFSKLLSEIISSI